LVVAWLPGYLVTSFRLRAKALALAKALWPQRTNTQ